MNGKTLLLVTLVTTYGLGCANAANVSVQTDSAHDSGHVALNEDRTAAARAINHTQAIPGSRSASTQAPARALNQDIYHPPYTY